MVWMPSFSNFLAKVRADTLEVLDGIVDGGHRGTSFRGRLLCRGRCSSSARGQNYIPKRRTRFAPKFAFYVIASGSLYRDHVVVDRLAAADVADLNVAAALGAHQIGRLFGVLITDITAGMTVMNWVSFFFMARARR